MVNLFRTVPQGMIGPFFNSAFPQGVTRVEQSYSMSSEPFNLRDLEINKNDLLKLVDFRFKSRFKDQPHLTTIFGDPDFLPFSFLTLGVMRGASVCRLLVNYEDLAMMNELIEVIRDSGNKRGKPYSITELSEILSIKDPNFFNGFDDQSVYQALEDSEKIKQIMPISAGTGFMVGRNYMLTAQHVINSSEKLKNFIAEFNYEKDLKGTVKKVTRYELDPDFYVSDPDLDYALVKLKEVSINEDSDSLIGVAGDNFGWIPMIRDDKLIAPPLSLSQVESYEMCLKDFPDLQSRLAKPDATGNISSLPGEPVSIIQHPKGRFKEIVLSNNRVQGISNNFLYYEADADYSSSGSPVFNAQWQLVALHHAYISERSSTSGQFNVIGYEGTRIFRIIDNLEAQANNLLEGSLKEEVFSFIEKFVGLDFQYQISQSIGEISTSFME